MLTNFKTSYDQSYLRVAARRCAARSRGLRCAVLPDYTRLYNGLQSLHLWFAVLHTGLPRSAMACSASQCVAQRADTKTCLSLVSTTQLRNAMQHSTVPESLPCFGVRSSARPWIAKLSIARIFALSCAAALRLAPHRSTGRCHALLRDALQWPAALSRGLSLLRLAVRRPGARCAAKRWQAGRRPSSHPVTPPARRQSPCLPSTCSR